MLAQASDGIVDGKFILLQLKKNLPQIELENDIVKMIIFGKQNTFFFVGVTDLCLLYRMGSFPPDF
jgi:hypothetical protein